MTTLWIRFAAYSLLDPEQNEQADLKVPYLNLFVSLGALTVPLLIGFLVRYWPVLADKMRKVTFLGLN